jgi:ketosteroid isomerase-like protein
MISQINPGPGSKEVPMHANQQTIERLYTAFAALDADTMASCYADDALFDDPAFSLKGAVEIGGMWHMLCDATKGTGRQDWRLEFGEVHADADHGHAHWEAHYRFSVTKRRVHNIIETEFSFTPQGLIATHKDRFDFWRWSRQALGFAGYVLGWAPPFRNQMRIQTRAALTKYLENKPAPSS